MGNDRDVDLAAVWNEFCDGMRTAGHALLEPAYPDTPLERTAGVEHLALLLETAIRWYVAGNDPDFPRFVHLNDTFELADNRFAAIRDDASYRITGDASTLFDINLSVHEGWPFLGQTNVWGDVSLSDMTVDEDGRFELVISREPHDGNWLEMPEGATLVQLREYYDDWELHVPGSFEIVRVGSEGDAPSRRTPQELEARLRDTVRWAGSYTAAHMFMVEQVRGRPANSVHPASRQQGGNRNIAYGFGRFDLEAGSSLILTFDRPTARLWGVHWLTVPWYQNPDLANRSTSVNSHDGFVNQDGRIRIVLSASDPGTPNWLDTGGYEEGIIVTRWVWGGDNGPAVEAIVAPDRDVVAALPEDTPRVDTGCRAEEQARRRRHFAARRR